MPSPADTSGLRDNHNRGTISHCLGAKGQDNSKLFCALTSYNLSFTAVSLRPELARIVAESYLAAGDWDRAKDRILSSNALQCRSASSAIRLERELRQRLETLTPDQVFLIVHATAEDRTAIAWLAACKHIRFAFEFAAEVLRDKLAAHDPVLRHSDYESYVENKGLCHPEFVRLTTSSKNKVRQVLLRMLTEVGILGKGAALGTIQRPALSPAVVRVISADSPNWLAGFLVPDAEIPHC
ncbi:MAG: hypothetical protein JW395_3368 [Nitrospira sp.]|nr:hypothetical protein [Nitrospira sp.]